MVLLDVPAPALSPGGVLVRTVCSLISAGTERSTVESGREGLIARARRQPEKVRELFDQALTQGVGSVVEKIQSKLGSYQAIGYSASGFVTEVGPEVISGSTRMKAGTAQKMVLNMLSSGAMTRLGYVYGNLMVHVTPRNSKLAARGVSILQQAAGVSTEIARQALRAAGNSVPVGLVMLQSQVDRREAERALKLAGGHVRRAIAAARSL